MIVVATPSQDVKRHKEPRVRMTWCLMETIRAPEGRTRPETLEGEINPGWAGLGCDVSQK